MRVFLFIVAALEIAIVSPIPVLDRWQANYRARYERTFKSTCRQIPIAVRSGRCCGSFRHFLTQHWNRSNAPGFPLAKLTLAVERVPI